MADAKISALPSVTALTPDAVVPIVQLSGGIKTTEQILATNLLQGGFIVSGNPNSDFVSGDDGDFVVVG